MKLLHLLAKGDQRIYVRLAVFAAISGGSSSLLLIVVNAAAEKIVDEGVDKVDWLLASAFAVLAVLYFFSEIRLVGEIGTYIETGINRLRLRLVRQLVNADFAQLERFGTTRLYDAITQCSHTISQNSELLAISLRSVILLVCVLAYIFWLSALAFFLVVTTTLAAAWVYVRFGARLIHFFNEIRRIDGLMFEHVSDLFKGIREVRMSSARSAALGLAFKGSSGKKRVVGAQLHGFAFQQFTLGIVAFYALLAVVVFIVPVYSPGFSGSVMKVSTAVLFMIGPISAVVQAWTSLGAAESAASHMHKLADELQAMAEPPLDEQPITLPRDFGKISLQGVAFQYLNDDPEHGFRLAPFNLDIRRNEIIFITGGNGSGKSTLIKLLTTLYRPSSGTISIDDMPIGSRTLASYRSLLSPIFSDFHLTTRLYGLEQASVTEAEYWLHKLEIGHLCGFNEGRFTNINLSLGQRKRLALVAAILENRPLLILDEWAADQDPHFRSKFYREILPELKQRGFTIIAVTHDDHYFDAADRHIHLENGSLSQPSSSDHKEAIDGTV